MKEEFLPAAALAAIETRRAYPRGYEFFAPGEPALGIYILYGGRARLTLVDSEGEELTLGFAGPGDILGLSAAVTGQRHEERAEATLPCEAGFIKGRDFLHFLGRHPEAAFWTVQHLSQRVATAFAHLSSLRDIAPRRIT